MGRGPAVVVEYRGERLSLAQLSERCGIAPATLHARVRIRGWTVERAASVPVRHRARSGGRPAENVPRPCPRLKRHPSGRAYSRWKMGGKTHERYFGKHGTPDAATAYRRFGVEWANGSYDPQPAGASAGGISAGSLAARWFAHCLTYYVKDGKPTSEITLCRAAARLVNDLHGDRRATEFDPAALRVCRDTLVARGLVRNTCNAYVSRVVRMFAWGAAQSLLPAAVHGSLVLVEQLAPGRTVAPDRERKRPATDAQIEATLPHLAPSDLVRRAKLAAMVRLQRLTGMRPGEVCALAASDLDAVGEVWRYTVGKSNKNLHRGRPQVYYLGPKAVAILTPLLTGAPAGRLFGETANNYGHAIMEASVKGGAGRWSPHQLRHALATAVAEKFRSLEHAAAAIGDTEAVAAAVYIHVDPRERAKIEVARAMG